MLRPRPKSSRNAVRQEPSTPQEKPNDEAAQEDHIMEQRTHQK